MTRLYIIDPNTGTEGCIIDTSAKRYVFEPESVRNARRLLHAMAEDEARREWRPSVPKWLPFFIVGAFLAFCIGFAAAVEWWLS